MGVQYYLHDSEKHEVYDTGKWQPLHTLVELLPACNGDEAQIKYLIREEYAKCEWDEDYKDLVVEDIYRFLKGRDPKAIRVVSEHDLFDNGPLGIYDHKTAQVGNRYCLTELWRNQQDNQETTERWAKSWERAQKRSRSERQG
jgi:hypothetical protein